MVFVGSDHGGFTLKQEIIMHLEAQGIEITDLGCHSLQSVDYPDYAKLIGQAVLENKGSLGILICGTGIGVSIAANKIKGIRAALCSDTFSARMARAHNDAQILCMGGRVLGVGLAADIADAFLGSSFESDRHQRRVDKIMELEKNRP